MLVVDVGSWALTAAMIVGEQVHPVHEPLTGTLRWPAGACLDGRELLVGAAAERHREIAPRRYLEGIRRTIDSSAPVWFGEQQINGVEALAAALDAIATEARRRHSVDRLVLTVPSAYRTHDPRREAILSAASVAGFPDAELVTESVAAALDPLTRIVPVEGAHLLVFDLGATWTAALVQVQHGHLVQVGQETSGGGRDLDTLLAADLRAALPGWTEPALDAGGDTAARAAFRAFDVVRLLKHRLSEGAVEEAAERPEPGAPAYRLTRPALEHLAEPSLRWLVASARAVVARAGIHLGAVSAVILTGGCANLAATGPILHSGLGRPVTRPPEPELGVLRGAARWAIGLPDRAVPADPPQWRIEPLSWEIPGGRARLVRWVVKEGGAYGPHALLAQVRTAEDRVYDLTAGRAPGVLLEHRVEVGGVVAAGALAATVRTATNAERFQLIKRHHLEVAGRWMLLPDRRRLVEWPGSAEYVKVRNVASAGLVNELRPGADGGGARRGTVVLGPGQQLALVTWDAEGNFAVWDVASGQLTAKFSGGHRPHLVLVSEARWRLVTTADSATSTGRYRRDVATVWDLSSGTRIDKYVGEDLHRRFTGYAEHSTADAFVADTHSPDARLRATAHDNAVSVRDVGQDSEAFRTDRPDAGQARVAFSHDGRHLLVRWDGDETGTVEIFEVLG